MFLLQHRDISIIPQSNRSGILILILLIPIAADATRYNYKTISLQRNRGIIPDADSIVSHTVSAAAASYKRFQLRLIGGEREEKNPNEVIKSNNYYRTRHTGD